MKQMLMLVAFCLWGSTHAQVPELIYYQFNNPAQGVVNHAQNPVGALPAVMTGNLKSQPGGFLNSRALSGNGDLAGTNRVLTGWNTRIDGSFTLAFWTKDVPVSNTLFYIFGDPQAGEFRCFTNGVAGHNNWMVRGGELPDLPVTGAATAGAKMVHIVYDSAAATYTSYVNGVQNTQVMVDSVPDVTGSGLTIGGYANNFGLNGLMDEIRWYDRALDQNEISNTYNIDLNIRGNCPPFSNFRVDTVLATSALLSWNRGTGNAAYYLEYGREGFTPGQGNLLSGSYPSSPSQVMLNNLTPNTTYELYFGELCGNGDSAYLPNPIKITTTRLCASPANLQLANISPYAAQVSWAHAGNTTEHYVIYGYRGFDPRLGGQMDSVSIKNHTIAGLSPATDYDIYLASHCAAGKGVSDTIGPLSITTQCAPVTAFPYQQNFEPAVVGGPAVLPQCWQVNSPNDLSWAINRGATPSAGTGPGVDHTTDSISGSYMYLETSMAGSPSRLLTPEFDLTSLTTPAISFWYHMFGPTTGTLELQVSMNSGSWMTVARLNGQQHYSPLEGWKKHTVDVSQFISNKTRFRFVGSRGSSFTGDMAIDDVVVGEGQACIVPSVFLTSKTDSSATFNLVGGGTAYNVEWGNSGFTLGNACKSVVSNGSFSIDNLTDPACNHYLQANRTYDIYVWNECGTDKVRLSFTTDCSDYTAPYSNNFDNETLWQLPSCWDVTMAGSSIGSGAAEVYNYGSASTAPHHLRLYNGGAQGPADSTLLISPHFSDMNIGSKQVRFRAKAKKSGSQLIVGTLSDPHDASGFNALDTLDLTTAYQTYIVSLVNGSDQYVGILHGNVHSYSTIYLDDFNYEAEPSCIPPLASGAGVKGTSFNSAMATWGTGGQGLATQLEWGSAGFTPGIGQSIGQSSVPGSVHQYSITGLTANTTYELYLRDSCGFDDESPWIGPFPFSTNCLPLSAPFTESFDGQNWQPGSSSSEGDSIAYCWKRSPGADGTYKWGVFNGSTGSVGTGPDSDHSGSGNYIYTEASSGQTGDRAELYTPWVDVSALSRPYLEFYYHRFGNNLGDLLVEVRNLTSVWDTLVFIDSEDHSSGMDPYLELGARLGSYGDTVQVRFVAVSKGCCAGDMAIDEVSFTQAPSCPVITGLEVSNIMDTAATVSWDSSAEAGSYQLWIGQSGTFVNGSPTGGRFIDTNNLQIVLDTLPEETCYQLSVRSVCAPGDTSDWTVPVDFCTLCKAQMAPHTQNFDQMSSGIAGNLGDCWLTANANLQGYGWRTHSGPTLSSNTGPMGDGTGNGGNYIYTEASSGSLGDEAALYSARLDLSALSQPELRFAYFMYGVDIDTLHVDVRDNNGWHQNVLTLDGQQQFYDSDPWKDTIVDLNSYNGSVQLRFRTYRGSNFRGDLALDDIVIADPTTCPVPTGLDTSAITTTSADLRWNGGANGTYELAYAKALVSTQAAQKVVVNGNSYNLTGLAGGMQYGFMVRKICGPRDTSQWAGPFYFHTKCVPVVNAPYYSNFEGITIGQQSVYENCWTVNSPAGLSWESEQATGANFNTVSTGPYFDNTLYPAPQGTYMFLESSSTGSYSELVSPKINATAVQSPELVYHFHMYGKDINKLEVYLQSTFNGSRYLIDSIIGQKQVSGSMPFWERRIDLSSIPVSKYRIVFKAYKGASYKGDIAIDDMWIDEAGSNSCVEPLAMSVGAKGCDSITVNWTSVSNRSLIEYGPVGFKKGQGQLISNVSAPYTITGLSPSTLYSVKVANVCGTDTSAFKTLSNVTTLSAPKPVAVINYTDSVFNSKNHGAKFFDFNAYSSVNATDYYWDFGNGQTDSSAQAVASYVFNKEYTVKLIASNGCGTDTATLKVNVDIDVDENPLSRSLYVYPNPATDKVNLSFTTQKDGKASVRLFDVTGKELMRLDEENINGVYRETLDISKLAGGVYLLEVDDGEYHTSRKLIKP